MGYKPAPVHRQAENADVLKTDLKPVGSEKPAGYTMKNCFYLQKMVL